LMGGQMALHKVLCVDDEELLLKSLRRVLGREPYELLIANDGYEALELLAKNEIAVIVADQRMPRMTGTELLAKVRQQSKATVRVILSGYADLEVMMDSINRGNVYMYIKKPWNDERLKAQIRQCIVHYETTKQNETLVEHLHFQQAKIEKSQNWMAEKHGKLGPYIQLFLEGLRIIPLPVVFIDHQCQVVFVNDAAKTLFPSLEDIEDPIQMEEVLIQDLTSAIDEFVQGSQMEASIDGFPGEVKIQRVEFEDLSAGCVLSFIPDEEAQ